MRLSLPFVLLAATLTLGCTGSTSGTTATPATEPTTAGATMSITEPWKSMNLPIEGAVVEFSTKSSIGLKYPTHTQATANGIVGVLIEAVEGLGYTKGKDKDVSSMRVVEFEHPTDGVISLVLNKDDERPFIKLNKR